jgi:protein-tyrosine phosphatase
LIDLHSHVLPAVDDGARTLEESLAIARSASGLGVRMMAATPHVRASSRSVDIRSLSGRVRELNEALVAERIPLVVETGGALDPARLLTLTADELELVSLAGSRYVLVETPYERDPIAASFESLVRHAIGEGIRPVLAHPERNPRLATVPLIESLVADGALVQVTAASLVGEFGSRARGRAFKLIRAGLAHVVASDVHRVGQRLPAIDVLRSDASELGAEFVERLALLLEEIPAAVVADEEIRGPLPPLRDRSRSRWGRLQDVLTQR